MKVDGRCHCGKVRYEADVDPEKVVICHCTDCQTMSGSAFRTVVATYEGGFRLLSGVLKTYVKTGDSGNSRALTFCPDCGTPIHSAPPGEGPKVFSLRVGSIRQRDRLVPQVQYWCRSAQPWLGDLAKMDRQERQPVFGTRGAFGEA